MTSMLYEVATGKLAFRNLSQFQLINHILVEQQREPIPDTVTEFTKDLIEQCWSQNPEDRPSFAEICSLLSNKAHLLFPDSKLQPLVEFLNYVNSIQ